MPSIHIAKAGARAVSVEGVDLEFTPALLAEVAQTYSPRTHEAPLVIGHPKLTAPAYGWVRGLSFADGHLVADVDPQPELVGWVKQRLFSKVSAQFYPPASRNNPTPGKWHLAHIGFLGANPPAIKGLPAVSFAEGQELATVELDAVSFGELSGYFGSSVTRLLRRLRDWLVERDGLEKADAVLPQWELDGLSDTAAAASQQETEERRQEGMQGASFADRAPDVSGELHTPIESRSNHAERTSSVSAETQAALAAEKARADRAEAELQALRGAEAQRQAQARQAECASFADKLIGEARWPAGARDVLVATLVHLETPAGDSVVSFGEGDAAQPLASVLRTQLLAMPAAVSFAEHARNGGAREIDPVALGHKAAALVADEATRGITITAAEAVARIQEGA